MQITTHILQKVTDCKKKNNVRLFTLILNKFHIKSDIKILYNISIKKNYKKNLV